MVHSLSLVVNVFQLQHQPRRSVASMACEVGYCSRENLVWLTYAASGNMAFCLRTERLFCAL